MHRKDALRLAQGFGLTIDPVPLDKKRWAQKNHLPTPRWQLSNGQFFHNLEYLVSHLPKGSPMQRRSPLTVTRASELNRLVSLSHVILPPKNPRAVGPKAWSFDANGHLTTVMVDLDAIDQAQLNADTKKRMGL